MRHIWFGPRSLTTCSVFACLIYLIQVQDYPSLLCLAWLLARTTVKQMLM